MTNKVSGLISFFISHIKPFANMAERRELAVLALHPIHVGLFILKCFVYDHKNFVIILCYGTVVIIIVVRL